MFHTQVMAQRVADGLDDGVRRIVWPKRLVPLLEPLPQMRKLIPSRPRPGESDQVVLLR
jgi:hypothetical protein